MNQAASGRHMAQTAGALAVLSLLAKPVNFLKDIIVAAVFGTTAAKDAFLVAWALPEVFSGLVTEGLSGVLVPIFTEYASRGDEERAWRVASSIVNIIVIVLCVAVVVVAVAAPFLVSLLAPAFPAETRALAVRLARLVAVSMVFMGLQGLVASVLNAHQRFLAPALAPLALNLTVIVVVLALAGRSGIDSLALAMVIGTLAGVVVQTPRLPWDRLRYWLRVSWRDEGTQRFIRLAGPLVLGTLILSSTGIINRIFASFLPAGSLAALDFALRTTGPAYVVAPSIATVLLPTLSRQASLGQWADFQSRLALGIKMHLLVALPASAAFIILSQPIVRILFQRGAFDAESTAMTAGALAWYAVGLVFYGLFYMLTSTFYALQNTVIRIQAGLLLVGTYAVGNLALMGLMKANGLALSYSVAHMAACILLLIHLGKRLEWRIERVLAGFTTRVLTATVIMGATLRLVQAALAPLQRPSGFGETLVATGLAVVVGAAVYGVGLWLLGVTEVGKLRHLWRR